MVSTPDFLGSLELSSLTLFQDSELILINKPAGILVHPTPEAPDKVTLLSFLRQSLNIPIFPVHRLDRNTTGVMVFAKSKEAARKLQDQMNGKGFYKEYLALVRDHFSCSLISERSLKSPTGQALASRTEFHPLYFFGRATLIKAVPLTGRHHQIRRHLAHMRHQIIGDTKYGKGNINRYYREQYGLYRMFLHACTLSFAHPQSAAPVSVHCPLPMQLQKLLHTLRINVK